MAKNVALADQIDDIKRQLELVVITHKYNFMHPDVIKVSRKLDDLILRIMKKQLA
jgi:Spo0E like sporulation regulatory protein.